MFFFDYKHVFYFKPYYIKYSVWNPMQACTILYILVQI